MVLAQAVVTLGRGIDAIGAVCGDEVFFVERVRKAGNEVVAINRSWIPKEIGARLSAVDLSSGSIYEVLEKHCDVVITGGWERIRAAIPAESDRVILELAESVPVLSLERAAYSGKTVIEWRESLVRDDRFFLAAQWGSQVWQNNKLGG